MAPKRLKLSQPSKGIREMGMTRKECGKNCPARCRDVAGGAWGKKEERGEEQSPQGPAHGGLGSIPPRFSVSNIIGFLCQRNKPIKAEFKSIKADLLRAALE